MQDLRSLLSQEYSLAMAPGFFRVYAHVGLMHALEDNGLLHPVAVCGSSAGAMSAGFYAAGLQPSEMIQKILAIDRAAMWDVSFGLGLLKGEKLRRCIDDQLPNKTFESCAKRGCRLGMTAWDVFSGFQTKSFHTGNIAENMCASACFPGLFQPRVIAGRPYIDAGLSDDCGMISLPCLPQSSKLIVNFLVDVEVVTPYTDAVPLSYQEEGAMLLTICCNGLPQTNPFNMTTAGKQSYESAKAAMDAALNDDRCHVMKLPGQHWAVYVDCKEIELNMSVPSSSSEGKRAKRGRGQEQEKEQRDLSKCTKENSVEEKEAEGGQNSIRKRSSSPASEATKRRRKRKEIKSK